MRNFISLFFITIISLSAGAQSGSMIDAAFALNDDIVYFIKGKTVVEFDFENDKVLNVSSLDDNVFPGVTFSSIDAALNYNGKVIYFFSGQYYIRFDIENFSADQGYPKSISQWNVSFSDLDAALSWPGKAYFFKGNQYIRYSKDADGQDAGYPKQTNNSTWPGLPYTKIDAALAMPSGKSYFFRGNEYVRYDQKTDKADPGYPKSLSAWPGLEKALNGSSSNVSNTEVGKKDNFFIQKYELNLQVAISDPSSILCKYFVKPANEGGFYLAYQNKNDVYLQKISQNMKTSGAPVEIKNYWISDFLPMKDGSIIFLLGKDVNNTYISGYPNSLYFLKMNANGTFHSPKLIFGENKHTAGESWFDGRSRAKINFNGNEFGIYFEVQKNWAKAGEKDDIHNGDMFVATDLEGNLKKGREHFWTASHSSTINLSSAQGGDFYTLTIGDAHPYGLQLYNRNTELNTVVWPPKEDYVAYENVKSTNAAGLLRYMDVVDGSIISIMGTLEHPNIGVFDKVDPLFLKFDTKGSITKKVWLAQTPEVDESNISVWKLKNEQYLLAWGPGNVYEDNWEAGNVTISVIDNNGIFTVKPKELNYSFGTYSQIIQMDDGRFVWVNSGRSPSKSIQVFVGKLN